MPETERLVINTGPILAIIAGTGDLELLRSLYKQVLVPYEVCQEVLAGGVADFGIPEFNRADFLDKRNQPTQIQAYLRNSLDLGESSVIQLAIDEEIQTICIDEAIGRRIARLNELTVTGSLGILVRAKNEGHSLLIRDAIQRMQVHGVWLSERVINMVLKQVGE